MTTRSFRFIGLKRISLFSSLIALGVVVLAFSFRVDGYAPARGRVGIAESDSAISQKAFMEVYRVFMSPRCMNCHPSGDVPLQGDDNHLHPQGVKRGPEGKGLYALKCTNCHQAANTPGLNMPPGVPDWHLPPAHMRMVFQGRSPHELAVQIKDRRQNDGKSPQDLIAHMRTALVRWAWAPGEGRSKPPMSYEAFYAKFKLWIDKGAVPPPVTAR